MKPILIKNYGSIGHLPKSRLGPGDHSLQESQAKILTETPRDHKDLVIVQEKLDGANVGVLRLEDGRLVGLTRKGHRCEDSALEQFQMFEKFINKHKHLFDFLEVGERVVGEWLAMAHGTKYKIQNDFPFVAFDILKDHERESYLNFRIRIGTKLPVAHLLHIGQPISIKKIEKLIDIRNDDTYGYHGSLEPVEEAVWRVEREGKVDFLGKYVRAFKEDGKYFHEDHNQLIWNWKPCTN
ncbi:MAG TPA: RNA ligase family protein [Nitrososphaeraceae archaeon]|nr:RNA ligase family protein [Nitrososphaeraceae archaeon]